MQTLWIQRAAVDALSPHGSIFIYCCCCKSLQSCPTLCDPIDGSPPGSPVPGILQARTLEWVAISFSNAWKWKVKSEKWKWSRSVVSDSLATPWAVACQAPLSTEFSRQGYWIGLPFPSPGDLPDPGIKPGLPVSFHSGPAIMHATVKSWLSDVQESTETLACNAC